MNVGMRQGKGSWLTPRLVEKVVPSLRWGLGKRGSSRPLPVVMVSRVAD